ncbi:MAG: hypothetical protein A3G52_00985 [Candidatus Taylorbacteria bacterium RIFCSPLOWO2_12_FULL_43_20]|uniref:Uncharacterized protein n=1 Tax=Candidatus Taylorbacteria bacterium RIFCSPLOWO2_12_FULL_43_20 TaxID=1802332 RepID=A0A1G2P261_9BACT|nr:MAG: hypothetical protein A2825_01405 [Candidatus Taylorbacteria bacterium RIFCSPHIGHO2_01_FULL_43_120]OHA38061.1 MAG: hypothetical protein A3H58_01125 [Candidatus Taylorbacteria bacterium RIFCSPLOWO2_02_FULL_43_22b]OHA41702.1 MAG: hypothetical protein A3G52_00985 [Candidatus Taylorbacteria bacterium RIFCSPLOWO2_12_FULL_43_20]
MAKNCVIILYRTYAKACSDRYHSREGGNPGLYYAIWIPAFAGMTDREWLEKAKMRKSYYSYSISK